MIRERMPSFSQQRESIQLPEKFFTDLLKSQEKYNTTRDKQSMSSLLTKYTDLVAYFEAKQQPATQYFQAKIKNLLTNVKYFTHSPADRQVNKAKLNKDMYKVMEVELDRVQKDIKKDLQKQIKMSNRVSQILIEQNSKVDERIRNSRRSLCKSNSRKNTLSFNTFQSTLRDPKNSITEIYQKNSKKRDKTISCISKKNYIDEDIEKYLAEGAVIITDYQQDSDCEEWYRAKQKQKLKGRIKY